VVTVEATSGQDRIADFQLGADRIDVQPVGISSCDTVRVLLGREVKTGSAGIQFSSSRAQTTVIVSGVTPDDLIPADFV